MEKKKRNASDIRNLISDEADFNTHIRFKCSKKKERLALQLIADEMDEMGIGFKEALINVLISDTEPVITGKRISKRMPKTHDEKIDFHRNDSSEAVNEKHENSVEIAPEKEDDIESVQIKEEAKKSVADIISEKKQQSRDREDNKEEKNNLSAEDKASLRQRLINSYKL